MKNTEWHVRNPFWSEQLKSVDAPTPLMIDAPADVRLPPDIQSCFHAAQEMPAKAQPGFWSALWALLLGRYSNEDRVLFGVVAAGKTMPVLVSLTWQQGFTELLAEHSKWLAEALKQPSHDVDELQRHCTKVPKTVRLLETVLVPPGETDYDYSATLVVHIEASGYKLEFDARRLQRDAVMRLAQHLESLMTSVTRYPDDAILEASMLPPDEFDQVVHKWNATEVPFPRDKCLHQQFEDRVRADSSAAAVTFGGKTLSYGQLNQRSNRIAHRLLQLGVQRDTPVAVSLRRSTDMAAAMMAICKAGAGYLPLDPEYPPERLQFMLSDSAVDVLITQRELQPLLEGSGVKMLVLDDEARQLDSLSDQNPEVPVKPTDLAYLIYTSGSTGMPKGVMVDHLGRVSNFYDFNTRFNVGPGDRLLGISSMSFDMCAYDVFGTLAVGAELVIGESGGDLDPLAWAELLVGHKVTVWHSVPALLEMVIDQVESMPELHPRSMRLVLLGGDWIPVTLPDRVKAVGANSIQVISMGGATEVSMDSTIYEIRKTDARWKSIPYGAPMWNQRAYVLDRMMKPMPVGVPGELYLGGIGVGRGYHNRQDLTNKKFVENPFVPGERMYRTGDLCRWRSDGNLQILGRMDFQVKIQGFRIELGEIESALREHPAVRETVVMARDAPGGGKRLVAYVVRNNDVAGGDAPAVADQATVNRWADIFDSAYDVPPGPDEDPTFRIVSWASSFTGQPFSAETMREWVDKSVSEISAFHAKRIFEIGCGTGLMLFRLAPNCEFYHGTDMSEVALQHVRNTADKIGLGNIKLSKREAIDVGGIDPHSFDLVVINSVAQNFPSAEYFLQVIENASSLLRPGGSIFLGDLRDKVSELVLQSSVALARATNGWNAQRVLADAERRAKRQDELIVDPRVFYELHKRLPGISAVRTVLRQGNGTDEMTRFRFNATLTFNGSSRGSGNPKVVEYEHGVIRECLEAKDELIEVRNIPNARIWPDMRLYEYMQSEGTKESVQELKKRLARFCDDRRLVSPQDVVDQAKSMGRLASCRFAASGDRAFFDATISRGLDPVGDFRSSIPGRVDSLSDFFNVPLDQSIFRDQTPVLREHLSATLPYYMVPAAFVFLDAFPLSPNGKVNRRELPEPDNVRPVLDVSYAAPDDDVERVLERLWADGLGLDRVGMQDPFLAIGGGSLLATQLVSKVRDTFHVRLKLKHVLNGNLMDVKSTLLSLGAEQNIDVRQVAEIYMKVMAMSDNELDQHLEASS